MAVDPTTDQSQSAKALLESTLATYGLSALAGRVWEQYLNGIPIEQIMLDLRQTPEYKARFPGMAALSQKGRAITEGEYISLERQYASMARQYGLPAGFYDQSSDFTAWIEGEVSPNELGERFQFYRQLVYEEPPGTRDEMQRLYGLTVGDLTAWAIDPTKALPVLANQFLAAQVGSASNRAGFGNLTVNEAERLAQSGVTSQQAEQGFGVLADSTELFAPLIGDAGEDVIGRDEQLGGVFGGNANARRRIEQRARKRAARFDEGGTTSFGSS